MAQRPSLHRNRLTVRRCREGILFLERLPPRSCRGTRFVPRALRRDPSDDARGASAHEAAWEPTRHCPVSIRGPKCGIEVGGWGRLTAWGPADGAEMRHGVPRMGPKCGIPSPRKWHLGGGGEGPGVHTTSSRGVAWAMRGQQPVGTEHATLGRSPAHQPPICPRNAVQDAPECPGERRAAPVLPARRPLYVRRRDCARHQLSLFSSGLVPHPPD